MIYVALSSAVFIFFFFILLLTPLTRKQEKVKSRIKHIDGMFDSNEKSNEDKFRTPLTQRFFKPILLKIVSRLSSVFPKLDSEKSKKILVKAGYKIQPAAYNVVQIFVIFATGIACMLIGLVLGLNLVGVILVTVFGLTFGMLILKYTLQHRKGGWK